MTPAYILAASLIGKPWKAAANGPDAFNCWGLVRYWFKHLHGLDMHDVAVAVESEQAAAIMAAARAGGWRRVDGKPCDGDIALMRNPETAGRHVGVILASKGVLRLLHCEGSIDSPLPGVNCPTLAEALEVYTGLELWRRTA
jgi:cell wall-associated NlpC family hydrolase